MIHSARVPNFIKITGLGAAALVALASYVSCSNSTGPSDTPPTLTAQTFAYYPGGSTGFVWTEPNVAFKDTAVSNGNAESGGYTVTPALPTGITMNVTTGLISGTPTDTISPKQYKVIATNSHGTDTALVYIGVFASTYPFALLAKGTPHFQQICADCHGNDALGGRCPPLHSDYLMADRHRPIRIQLIGLPNNIDTATTITVNGIPNNSGQYSTSMYAPGNGDSTIAGTLTLVRAYFNNAKDYITVQEVSQVRDSVTAANTANNWGYNIDGHADY